MLFNQLLRISTCLKDVVEANDVALDIHIRVLDGVANTSLGCKVDHHIELILGKESVNKRLVGNRAFHALVGYTFWNQFIQFLQPVFLQRHIVVRVEIIDVDNRCVLEVFKKSLFIRLLPINPAPPVTRTVFLIMTSP